MTKEPKNLTFEYEDFMKEAKNHKNTEHCINEECIFCGYNDCPHHEPLHYHHDGCPACFQEEVTKECPELFEKKALQTKLYITLTNGKCGKHNTSEIIYICGRFGAKVVKINRIADYNYIVILKYWKDSQIDDILLTNQGDYGKYHAHRIFKSIKITKRFEKEPCISFIDTIILSLSSMIKQKVDINIISHNADTWKKVLLERWQKEIENPELLKRCGITSVVDIAPNGSLKFIIRRTGNWIITYFQDRNIKEYL